MDLILKENGEMKVKITESKYGLEMYTTINGVQWTGFNVDEEMLKLMQLTIADYLSTDNKKNTPQKD